MNTYGNRCHCSLRSSHSLLLYDLYRLGFTHPESVPNNNHRKVKNDMCKKGPTGVNKVTDITNM